jgi:hypothetical protein
MPLTPGTRIGPCEILAPRGTGGMGEGFRARDSRVGLDVAIQALRERPRFEGVVNPVWSGVKQ